MTVAAPIEPYVHYHCVCQPGRPTRGAGVGRSTISTPGSTFNTVEASTLLAAATIPAALAALSLDTPPSPHSRAYPPSQLYFCEDCHALRCPSCTLDDVVSYYCPHCLFEVPSASVKGERNRCMRNCFSCPACRASLTVQAEESVLTTLSGQTSTTVGRYYLSCGSCRWDSREAGWSFERPNGLAAITRTQDDQRLDVREFEALKAHFERQLRGVPGSGAGLAAQLLLTPQLGGSVGALGPLTASGSGILSEEASAEFRGPSSDAGPPGSGIRPEEIEDHVVEELMTLTDADQISTIEQRATQLADQPYLLSQIRPERIHLRAKRLKRCRCCKHILIKPEQKAVATRFKIKLMAIHHVPIITIQELPKLQAKQSANLILRFFNPLYFPIDVEISSPDDQFKVIGKKFSVADYSDVWEYEDDVYASSTSKSGSGADEEEAEGVIEQRGSATTILINATPSAPTEDWILRLLVRYTYIETPEEDDLSDMTDEEGEDEDEDAPPKEKAPPKAETSVVEEGELREYAFWASIGLGPVLA